MNNEDKYYFAFGKKHELYGHWVEIFTYSEKEAMDVFRQLYGSRSWPLHKNALQYHPKGCHRQIYLPLPENIEINASDPFLSEQKQRNNFVWAMIGAQMTGKSSASYKIISEWEKNNPSKKVIIYDPGMD